MRTREADLSTKAARDRLPVCAEPHWRKLSEGEFVGYYRGQRSRKWVARIRQAGAATKGYAKATLGEADDLLPADGARVLSWKQAQAAAMKFFDLTRTGSPSGPYTVSQALDEYLTDLASRKAERAVAPTRHRAEAIIRPAFGAHEVAALSHDMIRAWHRARAASPARLRTGQYAATVNERVIDGPDAARRRKSTANRDLTVLKAALNQAFRRERVSSDAAWRRVEPFAGVDTAKLRYLTDLEARRLVNACEPGFRSTMQAALLTGARWGELRGAKVHDFNRDAGTLMLTDTKNGCPRACYLDADGARMVERSAAGKDSHALLFARVDGKRWRNSAQARPMARACAAAGLERTGFHDLRRTFGARLARRGVPMAVIAQALGHADERITRKHYAHLSPSYVADTVRASLAGLGIVETDNA